MAFRHAVAHCPRQAWSNSREQASALAHVEWKGLSEAGCLARCDAHQCRVIELGVESLTIWLQQQISQGERDYNPPGTAFKTKFRTPSDHPREGSLLRAYYAESAEALVTPKPPSLCSAKSNATLRNVEVTSSA